MSSLNIIVAISAAIFTIAGISLLNLHNFLPYKSIEASLLSLKLPKHHFSKFSLLNFILIGLKYNIAFKI